MDFFAEIMLIKAPITKPLNLISIKIIMLCNIYTLNSINNTIYFTCEHIQNLIKPKNTIVLILQIICIIMYVYDCVRVICVHITV